MRVSRDLVFLLSMVRRGRQLINGDFPCKSKFIVQKGNFWLFQSFPCIFCFFKNKQLKIILKKYILGWYFCSYSLPFGEYPHLPIIVKYADIILSMWHVSDNTVFKNSYHVDHFPLKCMISVNIVLEWVFI